MNVYEIEYYNCKSEKYELEEEEIEAHFADEAIAEFRKDYPFEDGWRISTLHEIIDA